MSPLSRHLSGKCRRALDSIAFMDGNVCHLDDGVSDFWRGRTTCMRFNITAQQRSTPSRQQACRSPPRRTELEVSHSDVWVCPRLALDGNRTVFKRISLLTDDFSTSCKNRATLLRTFWKIKISQAASSHGHAASRCSCMPRLR